MLSKRSSTIVEIKTSTIVKQKQNQFEVYVPARKKVKMTSFSLPEINDEMSEKDETTYTRTFWENDLVQYKLLRTSQS